MIQIKCMAIGCNNLSDLFYHDGMKIYLCDSCLMKMDAPFRKNFVRKFNEKGKEI